MIIWLYDYSIKISLYLPYLLGFLARLLLYHLLPMSTLRMNLSKTPRYTRITKQPMYKPWTTSSVSGSMSACHVLDMDSHHGDMRWCPYSGPLCPISSFARCCKARAWPHGLVNTMCRGMVWIRREPSGCSGAQAVTRYVRGVALPDLRKYI